MAKMNDAVKQHHRLAAGERITGMKHGGFVKRARYAEGGPVDQGNSNLSALADMIQKRPELLRTEPMAPNRMSVQEYAAAQAADQRTRAALRNERPDGGQAYKGGGKVKGKRGC